MLEPATRIGSGNREECLSNRFDERVVRARPYASEGGLQLGEGWLNVREIGGVSRQKEEPTAFGFNGLSHPLALMNTQVIHDHDLTGAQAGGQHLLNVDFKGQAIGGSWQDQSFAHALQGERGQQSRVAASVAWHLAHCPLAFGGAGIQRRQGNVCPSFVHKHQVLTGQLLGLLAPSGTGGFILFAGN